MHWSPWGFWSECSTECGPGIRIRSRVCLQSNGKPSLTNNNCVGDITEVQSCELFPCSVSEIYFFTILANRIRKLQLRLTVDGANGVYGHNVHIRALKNSQTWNRFVNDIVDVIHLFQG